MKILTVPSSLSQIEKIRAFLKVNFQGMTISEEDYYIIELSLLEICINIIRYAYPGDQGQITLTFQREEDKVLIEIRDKGRPFDPRESKTPDLEELMKSGKKGGLGIFLTRKLMDEVAYRRESGQNILTLTKNI